LRNRKQRNQAKPIGNKHKHIAYCHRLYYEKGTFRMGKYNDHVTLEDATKWLYDNQHITKPSSKYKLLNVRCKMPIAHGMETSF
jgi:hypothetical protein